MSNFNVDVRNMLADAAIGSGDASRMQQRVADKRGGAYTLYVQAAILAGSADVLTAASDALFDEIRKTGKVAGTDGKAHSVGAKPNKDGSGFVIPSGISAAKSYMLEALTRGFDLGNADEPRGFSEIRKEVMTAKENERRAAATGDDALRIKVTDALSALLERAKDANGAELAALAAALFADAATDTTGELLAKAA